MLTESLDAFAVAFGVVFLAELGDKTQLLVLAFSTRYRALPVVIGVSAGAALVMAASVIVGAALGALIPAQLILLAGGMTFLVFAAGTLLSGDEHEHGAATPAKPAISRSLLGAAVVVGSGFAVAELGDKSMLATLALAARADPVGTWAGATAAEIAVSLLAILVGRQLGTRIPPRLLRYLAAGAFAVFGVLLIVEGLA